MAEATQATTDDWKARAAKARIPTEAIIDGKASAAASGQTFDCVSPIDGKVLGRVAAGDAADVDRAVRARARRRSRPASGRARAPAERKKILLEAGGADDGAPRRAGAARDARHGQAHRRARRRSTSPARPTASPGTPRAIDKVYDEIAPTDPSALAMITREPRRRRGRRRAVELPAATWRRGRSGRRSPPATRWCSSRPSSRR